MEEVGTLLYYGKVHVAVATACFFFVTLSRSGEMEEVGTLLYGGKVHVAVATAIFFFLRNLLFLSLARLLLILLYGVYFYLCPIHKYTKRFYLSEINEASLVRVCVNTH